MAPLSKETLNNILTARATYYSSDDYNNARLAISVGAIVGIVISVVATIGICIAICICLRRSNAREKRNVDASYANARPAVPSSAFQNNNSYPMQSNTHVSPPPQVYGGNDSYKPSPEGGLGWSGGAHGGQHTGVHHN